MKPMARVGRLDIAVQHHGRVFLRRNVPYHVHATSQPGRATVKQDDVWRGVFRAVSAFRLILDSDLDVAAWSAASPVRLPAIPWGYRHECTSLE
jgi:hypothetical protein